MSWTRLLADDEFDALRAAGGLVCNCFNPQLERINWCPGAVQCTTCGKPPLDTLSAATARSGEPPAEVSPSRQAGLPPEQAHTPSAATGTACPDVSGLPPADVGAGPTQDLVFPWPPVTDKAWDT